jgi:hypothetical protein
MGERGQPIGEDSHQPKGQDHHEGGDGDGIMRQADHGVAPQAARRGNVQRRGVQQSFVGEGGNLHAAAAKIWAVTTSA